jgi:hypothetical protein
MFGAFGIVEVAGTALGVIVMLGAPEAITVLMCDPTQIAVATPVPNCSSLRREIDFTEAVSIKWADCSQLPPSVTVEYFSEAHLSGGFSIFRIPRIFGRFIHVFSHNNRTTTRCKRAVNLPESAMFRH